MQTSNGYLRGRTLHSMGIVDTYVVTKCHFRVFNVHILLLLLLRWQSAKVYAADEEEKRGRRSSRSKRPSCVVNNAHMRCATLSRAATRTTWNTHLCVAAHFILRGLSLSLWCSSLRLTYLRLRGIAHFCRLSAESVLSFCGADERLFYDESVFVCIFDVFLRITNVCYLLSLTLCSWATASHKHRHTGSIMLRIVSSLFFY